MLKIETTNEIMVEIIVFFVEESVVTAGLSYRPGVVAVFVL